MSTNSFVQYCHDIILSEMRAVISSPAPELWEIKIWYCACWRACISSGLAREFETEMQSEMPRDRIRSITLAIMEDCFNGIKFYKGLMDLYELLRQRGANAHISALNHIVARIYPHKQEFAMLAKGTHLPAAALAGIWNTRPNLFQMLYALGKEDLYNFKSLDETDLYSQPLRIGAAGCKPSLLTSFMRALPVEREDIRSFKTLRSVIERDGSLQIVEPQFGVITASLTGGGQPSSSDAVKFCLHSDEQRRVCLIKSAANAFSKARKDAK